MLLREDHFERWLALCFEHQTVEISGLKYTSRHTQLPTKNVNNVVDLIKAFMDTQIIIIIKIYSHTKI